MSTSGPVGAERRVVLLIDADNAQASKFDVVLDDLANEGETRVRRAYGDWDSTHLSQWKAMLHAEAIRPVQQYALTKGKNASDIAMVVDAMDLLYRDRPEVFGLMSSDADFTPLVMHLRERGADVIGYGTSKSPEAFVNACTRFLLVDKVHATSDDSEDEESSTDSRTERVPTNALRGDAKLVKLLREAVSGSADDTGWSRASAIGQRIRNQSSMDPRNYGYARITDLLRASELFEVRDENTSMISFRDIREAKAAESAKKPATRKSTAAPKQASTASKKASSKTPPQTSG